MNDDLTCFNVYAIKLLLNQHINYIKYQPNQPTTPPPPPPLRQTTNDRGVFEQTTVPDCAQTTLAALAKRQFGGLEWHLSHTLELGQLLQTETA